MPTTTTTTRARSVVAPRRAIARVALVLLLTFLLAPIAAVAAAKKPPPARGVKSDVKYVKCAVCQEVAKTLHRVAAKVREDKGKKLTEADVLEKVEKVCDPDAEEGEWLITHDLVERGKRLDMKHMGGKFGECGAECKTMQMACERIVSDRDTDVAEMLFTDGASLARAGIQAKLCNDANEKAYSACRKPAPALPKTRPKGPAFKEKDKKDVEMARLMKSMKGMGMGGMEMFSRDNMPGMGGGDDDDDGLGDDPADALGGYPGMSDLASGDGGAGAPAGEKGEGGVSGAWGRMKASAGDAAAAAKRAWRGLFPAKKDASASAASDSDGATGDDSEGEL